MIELLLDKREALNLEQLDQELKGAFPDLVAGLSAGAYGTRIHLTRPLAKEEATALRAAYEAHDPLPSESPKFLEVVLQEQAEQIKALEEVIKARFPGDLEGAR